MMIGMRFAPVKQVRVPESGGARCEVADPTFGTDFARLRRSIRRSCSGLQMARCLHRSSPMSTRHSSFARYESDLGNAAEHARRRAARWYAWLTSPYCTAQDRENFARWRRDADNAAAFEALLQEAGAFPGFGNAILDLNDARLSGSAIPHYVSPARGRRLEQRDQR
jgi:hypothetical protein